MSQAITQEERRANCKHWRFQDRMMREQMFKLARRMGASGRPRCYESFDGDWRISTAPGNLWKLERFNREIFIQGLGWIRTFTPITRPRYQTPLAMALWFNMMKDIAKLGVIKL